MSPDLPPQYCTYPQAMKFQENYHGSGQQSEYRRCYIPFASLYAATADSKKDFSFLFFFLKLLFSGKASCQVFTASYSKVLKIQVK